MEDNVMIFQDKGRPLCLPLCPDAKQCKLEQQEVALRDGPLRSIPSVREGIYFSFINK